MILNAAIMIHPIKYVKNLKICHELIMFDVCCVISIQVERKGRRGKGRRRG